MIAAFLQLPGSPLSAEGEVLSLSFSFTLSVYEVKNVTRLSPSGHYIITAELVLMVCYLGARSLAFYPLHPHVLPTFLILTQLSEGEFQNPGLNPGNRVQNLLSLSRMQESFSVSLHEKGIRSVFSFQILFPYHTQGTPIVSRHPKMQALAPLTRASLLLHWDLVVHHLAFQWLLCRPWLLTPMSLRVHE